MRAELPGHLANRLQAALWREAYSLVERGVATVADIDAAIAHGPGLRWALLGPFVLQHLSGGPGGLAHTLDHLGPPMVDWWRAMSTPELTPELTAAAVAGVEDELASVDRDAMVAERDGLLIDLLAAKAAAGLSHELVEGGGAEARARELATQLARNAPLANQLMLAAIPRIADMASETGLWAESLGAALSQSSDDAREGLRAFLEKRRPASAARDEAFRRARYVATAALGGRRARGGLEALLAAAAAPALSAVFIAYPLALVALGVGDEFAPGVRPCDVVAGVLGHLRCAALGGAIGVLFAPPRVTRRASAIAAVLAALLVLVAISGALGPVGGPVAFAQAEADAASGAVTGSVLVACLSCLALAAAVLGAASRWAGRAG